MTTKKTPQASTVSCSSSEIDLRRSFDPPNYDVIVNPEFFDDRHRFPDEHYMIPTTNPKDKRTLSLFNPEFLPNFNDMMMYASQPNEAVSSASLPWERADLGYHNASTLRRSLDEHNERYFTSTPVREPSYQSLRHERLNDSENLYASVVRNDMGTTVEYNC
uniref:Uncharacterized protein n=1 Tax=Bracon brevicornis TaxID=1563983 RepID=A0A6V7JWX8_9HYME